MKVAALAVVLTLVVGCQCATNCHWGPSYWCQNEVTAKECGGTKYCRDNVWKESPVSKPQGGIECEICKIVVDFIQKQLMDNKTEAEVKQALLQFCNSTGPLASSCVAFVNDEFDNIWNIIVNEGGADACSVLELCSSSLNEVPRPLKKLKDLECTECEKIAQKVLDLIESNFTKHEIKVEIKKVCPYMAGFAPECRMIINTFFDEIWNAATQAMSAKEICTVIKLCSASKRVGLTSFIAPKPKVLEAGLCDLCKMVVSFMKPFVDANNTEEEVRAALEMFCKILPGNASSECDKVVKDSFDVIWTLMKAEVDSGELCTMIQLCNSSRTSVLAKSQLRPRVQDNTTGCDMCKFAVSFIEPYVDSDKLKDEVKGALLEVCAFLPSDYKAKCNDTVNQYFDTIWYLLKAEVDGGEVCYQIGACKSKKVQLKLKLPQQAGLCDLCKLVATFMKPYVDSNSTEEEVKDALETVCSLLPGNISSECTDLVKTYFDMIWSILKQEVDSSEVCTMIKLCNDTKIALAKSQAHTPVLKGAECDMCKLVAAGLKPYVDSNKTENEVKDAIQKVCSLLPSGFKSTCNDTVNQYFDLIWQLLEAEVDGAEICKQIGLCTTYLKQSVRVGAKTTSDECEACKMVVKYLKDIVDSNTTESAAKAMIEAVCDKAGPMKDECDSMVDSYFPMVWKLLESYVDDDQICAEIKLCANVSTKILSTRPQSAIVQVQSAKLDGGVFCMVCELVMKEVTSMLDTNATQQAIEDALDKVCGVLPSSFKEDCTHFVDKYAPEIIQLILSGVAGKAVCTALGLCLLQEKQMVAVGEIGECILCETVLELAKTMIASKGAETKLDEVIENVCKLVPTGMRNECKDFIQTYGPQLIQLLEKAVDPKTICAEIKLCSKTAGAALMV